MWKYIVTWVITTTIPAPCPDANVVDEFGLGGNSMTSSCLFFHSQTINETKEKTFIERDSAFIFLNKGKLRECNNCGYGLGDVLTGIKIDSLFTSNEKP